MFRRKARHKSVGYSLFDSASMLGSSLIIALVLQRTGSGCDDSKDSHNTGSEAQASKHAQAAADMGGSGDDRCIASLY